MSWEKLIQPGPVWTGVEQYADSRIADLTAICTEAKSTEAEIRKAQAGIEEMKTLKALPNRLRATAEINKPGKARREY